MSVWVVPGSPLLDGSGWKIWYAHPGTSQYMPKNVVVSRDGNSVPTTQTMEYIGVPTGGKRYITIVTVMLPQPQPGVSFTLRVPELDVIDPDGNTVSLGTRVWQTFATELPEQGLSFLFGSCFWRNDDKEGHYYRAVDAIIRAEEVKPSFHFLCGDQIYLDYPFPSKFMNPTSARQKVQRRYEEYWNDPYYQKVLSACPKFFLCDDHEWWNDYPERQVQLVHTWGQAARKAYGEVATEYYEKFQLALNPNPTRAWQQFKIGPVSFFFADTRSGRDSTKKNNPHFMQEPQWQALEQWQRSLTGPGILVTGMPLFQKDGDWRDHTLSNFKDDYRRLTKIFTDSLMGKNDEEKVHDIVILSGDIHKARHSVAYLKVGEGLEVHELIASPASCIGPFTSVAKAEGIKGNLPESDDQKWAAVKTKFVHADNNIGLIRLKPVPNQPNQVHLEFVSYQLRPSRLPPYLFWRKEPPVNFNKLKKLYSCDKLREKYLK